MKYAEVSDACLKDQYCYVLQQKGCSQEDRLLVPALQLRAGFTCINLSIHCSLKNFGVYIPDVTDMADGCDTRLAFMNQCLHMQP